MVCLSFENLPFQAFFNAGKQGVNGRPGHGFKICLVFTGFVPARKRKGKKPIPPCRVNEALFQNAKTVRAGQRITQDDELVVIVVFQPAQIIADKRILPGGDIFFADIGIDILNRKRVASGRPLQPRPIRLTWRSHTRL